MSPLASKSQVLNYCSCQTNQSKVANVQKLPARCDLTFDQLHHWVAKDL